MSAAAPARPSKSVVVTVISLMTIVWGGAHTVLGGWFILRGDVRTGPGSGLRF